HPAVHHLDGAVETGALVAVVGPNGAGKSTLFKGIVGVIKPLAGRIERGDPNPQNIAYLPQAAEIDRTFPINVYDMVAMGLWRRAGSFGGIDRAARASAEQVVAAVGLPGLGAGGSARASRWLGAAPRTCSRRKTCSPRDACAKPSTSTPNSAPKSKPRRRRHSARPRAPA